MDVRRVVGPHQAVDGRSPGAAGSPDGGSNVPSVPGGVHALRDRSRHPNGDTIATCTINERGKPHRRSPLPPVAGPGRPPVLPSFTIRLGHEL